MGIIDRMERARIENPQVPLSSANVLSALGLEAPSAAGIAVTHDKALGITAFWAGVRMISQTIAGLPLQAFETQGNSRRMAAEHTVHKLLYKRPNPYMTPFVFKEIRSAHCLTWGNSYAAIERNGAGQPVALWPLLPDRTGVEIVNQVDADYVKMYWTDINGVRIWLDANQVLHVPGLGFDGLKGYNVIKIHRDSLGLSIAANEYGAQFFGNSGRPSGVLMHPGTPGPDERQQFREEWNQVHTGLTRAQRTAVLWGGMKWEQISLPPEEAQFLTTRQMQIEEVARILNINPILLQQTSKQTSWGSGVEKFLVAFAKFTITPWLEREEDVLNWDLFSAAERDRFYVKYNVNALLRGDAEMQAKVLEIKRRNGVINADEWRELDEENPLPDGQGKIYFVPLNWVPLDQANKDLDPVPTDSNNRMRPSREQRSLAIRRRLREAHKAAFEDGARRYVKRDVDALAKAVKRAAESGTDTISALNRWIDEFYPTQQRYIAQTMLPLVSALAAVIAAEASEEVNAEPVSVDTFAAEYAENLAMRETNSSIGQVRTMMTEKTPDELEAALLIRAEEWAEKRPGKVAENEIVRVASGAAKVAWAAAGVAYLVWKANQGACPLCMELDGKRVGIKEYFLVPGESVTPDERPGGLVAGQNLAGPPLHGGCQCSLQAGI